MIPDIRSHGASARSDKPTGRSIPNHPAALLLSAEVALSQGGSAGSDKPADRTIPNDPDALLLTAEVAFLLGLSPRTLEAWRLRGGGPPFVAVTPKAVRYRRCDLKAWIEARVRTSTSDPGGRAAAAGDGGHGRC